MIRRDISNQILEVSNHFPVVLITGARQVGKTTLFNNLITSQKIKREYVTLDDLDERALAQNDPKMFLQTHKPPVFIDEVQYAPNLFTYIKIHVDSSHKNGDFWLTGSQKFELMKNVSESLAGRVAIIDLLGISQSEIQNDNSPKTNNKKQTLPFLLDDNWLEYKRNENINFLNVDDIYKIIFRGSYPKLIADPKLKRETFYNSYIQSYIERDVKSLLKPQSEVSFFYFLKIAASRTGMLLNYTDIANSVDVDVKTIKSWISVLEASNIIKLLYPYYNNISKRLIKTPKLYFLDTGLVSYLSGWDSYKTLLNGNISGAILETYVFSEILKSYYNNLLTPNIYFYRDLDQKEIDFIIEQNGTLYPIEVKKSASPGNAKLHFNALEKFGKNVGKGALLCFYDKLFPVGREVWSVPVCYI